MSSSRPLLVSLRLLPAAHLHPSSLSSVALCLDLPPSNTLLFISLLVVYVSVLALLEILSVPAQIVSLTPLSLNYSVNYCENVQLQWTVCAAWLHIY